MTKLRRLLVAAAARGQEERVSLPAAGVHGDGQQSQLEIPIRAVRVRLLFQAGHNSIFRVLTD